MTTDGQNWAVTQLHEIADACDGTFEVVAIREPAESALSLEAEVSLDCSGYRKEAEGIPLRVRERFIFRIPADFPLDKPDAFFVHTRYASYPHVQWGKQICLYQATDTEWLPEDGMYSFVQRLSDWLEHAARGEFDPLGFPLHPPVAYRGTGRTPMVIPRVNAPVVEFPWWVGFVKITAETDVRVELGEWFHYKSEIPKEPVALAVLLPGDMPFEYPTTIKRLEETLAPHHLTPELIQLLLEMAALRNADGKPLYFILGAAMRGVSGETKRLQHLACWFVNAEQGNLLRVAVLKAEEEQGKVAASQFAEWANTAAIDWCNVREDRPEIVVPRDQGSMLSWWRGRSVSILGCGAIGGAIAILLARAGVSKMRLFDIGSITPGILVRQNYRRSHIGYTKVSATKIYVQDANPDIEVEALNRDVVEAIRENSELVFNADVVINATASNRVSAAVERHFRDVGRPRPPIAAMVLGHVANMALMTLAAPEAAGISNDIDRRMKIELASAPDGQVVLDEFWPRQPRSESMFQPEPGCSEPTFVGSAADVSGLSASMLNVLSRWLRDADRKMRRSYALIAPGLLPRPKSSGEYEFAWQRDFVFADTRQNYQIRMTDAARNVLLGWIRTSRRKRGALVETGGLLFGQVDDFLKVVWIDEVSGPPPDSIASSGGFLCGTDGTAELNYEKVSRTRGSVRFVGMWHTHPGGYPQPSRTDLRAMTRLWRLPDFTARHFLMLIVGGDQGWYHMAGHLFARRGRERR